MSQIDREKSLRETLLRYDGWQAGSHSHAGRRMADQLFLDLILACGDQKDRNKVAEEFSKALKVFQDAVGGKLGTGKGRGAPTTLRKTWQQLDLAFDGDAFAEQSGVLFYLVLLRVIEALLPQVRNEDILAALSSTSSIPSDDADDAPVAGAEKPDDGDEDFEEDDAGDSGADAGAAPSRQSLFLAIWESIAIELAVRLDADPKRGKRVARQIQKKGFAKIRGSLGQELRVDFERRMGVELKEGLRFAAILVELVHGSLGVRWFRTVKEGQTRTLKVVPTASFIRRVNLLSEKTVLITRHAPMIERPVPWGPAGIEQGGFYKIHLPFYKFKWANERIQEFVAAVNDGKLFDEVFPAVNALQDTPWRVNARVWDVVQSLYDIAGAPRVVSPAPELFPEKALLASSGLGGRDESARRLFEAAERQASERVARRNARLAAIDEASGQNWLAWIGKNFLSGRKIGTTGPGDRLAARVALSTVIDAARRERFYFAYQADARGRVYPVAGSFHPQGEELVRALLEFADAKPIDSQAARYLAIHGTQQVDGGRILRDLGNDARRSPTLDERVRWVDLHTDKILTTAGDPLADTWWCEISQSPFMFLAFCFAWHDWKNGVTESRLPVFVDGTCNGVQHIATLVRDRALAAATNVLPGEMPRDIYGEVADIVRDRLFEKPKPRETRQKTGQLGAADYEAAIRFLRRGTVKPDRAMAKRVVMIIPYGAGLSIYQEALGKTLVRRLLPEWKAIGKVEFSEDARWILKQFPGAADSAPKLTPKTGKRKKGARPPELLKAQQDWLVVSWWLRSVCARHIAEHFDDVIGEHHPSIGDFKKRLSAAIKPVLDRGIPVMWASPSGFPVLQDGFKSKQIDVDVKFKVDGLRVRFALRQKLDDIKEANQQKGILPNFIHSHDAAHLVKAVNLARARGVTCFGAVHDGFATHACDIAALGACLREAYLQIYPPEVDRLAEFEAWCATLAGRESGSKPAGSLTRTETVLLALARSWDPVEYDHALGLAFPHEKPEVPERVPNSLNPDWIEEVLVSRYFFA